MLFPHSYHANIDTNTPYHIFRIERKSWTIGNFRRETSHCQCSRWRCRCWPHSKVPSPYWDIRLKSSWGAHNFGWWSLLVFWPVSWRLKSFCLFITACPSRASMRYVLILYILSITWSHDNDRPSDRENPLSVSGKDLKLIKTGKQKIRVLTSGYDRQKCGRRE